jgi:hypothetical protein
MEKGGPFRTSFQWAQKPSRTDGFVKDDPFGLFFLASKIWKQGP